MNRFSFFGYAILAVVLLNGLSSRTASAQSTESGWGHLSGRIILTGALPKIENELIPEDQAICTDGKEGMKDDNLIVSKNRELADVFVYLRPNKDERLPVHPSLKNRKDQFQILELKECRIQPHALIVSPNDSLVIKNCDEVGHSVRMFNLRNNFNVMVARQSKRILDFQQPEQVPGRIECNLHRWMDSQILISPTPYACTSKKDGSFEIKNIPAGEWTFCFFHSRFGYLNELKIQNSQGDKSRLFRGRVSLEIGADKLLNLGTLKLPTSSIRSANKKEVNP